MTITQEKLDRINTERLRRGSPGLTMQEINANPGLGFNAYLSLAAMSQLDQPAEAPVPVPDAPADATPPAPDMFDAGGGDGGGGGASGSVD